MVSCIASCNVLFKGTSSDGFGASLPRYNGHDHLISAPFKPSQILSPSGRKRGIRMKTMAYTTTREKEPKKRVVITGMGIVSVFGNDIDVFYDKLVEGQNGISLIDKFDTSNLAVRFGGQIRNFSSKGYMDTKMEGRAEECWRYFTVAGKRALEDSKLLENMNRKRIGVILGTGMGGRAGLSFGLVSMLQKGRQPSPYLLPYSMPNSGSSLFAIEAGLTGPNYTITTACASGTTSICAAANHIRRGDADAMVVGGADAMSEPVGIAALIATGALSKRNHEPHRASRPWDISRDGFVVGEGAGVLVMETLEVALKRGANIIAEYLGGAVNFDAHHITSPRADGLGIFNCITAGLQDAGVCPEEVNYVNCHATSTIAGDVAELAALKQVFKPTSHLKINSTKSIIGHPGGAAGALEAIVTIKAINTGWLHPTINQDDLDPLVTFDTVPNVKKRHQVDVAISNSFGFGGHNAVAVFAPYIE